MPIQRRARAPFASGGLKSAICLAAILATIQAGIAIGQPTGPGARSAREFGFWTALALNQPLKTRLGHTHDRDLFIAGLRGRWLLHQQSLVEVSYTADVLPIVVSTAMPFYTEVGTSCTPSTCTTLSTTKVSRKSVYGGGLVPLGFELRVGGGFPLKLVMRGSAGVVEFSRRVPDPGEQRLNFILDAGVAAEAQLTRRIGLGAGFRFDHISNAGTGAVNPGMNSRMLELGVFWSHRKMSAAAHPRLQAETRR